MRVAIVGVGGHGIVDRNFRDVRGIARGPSVEES